MSPSEFDLRAALRRDEASGTLDADRIMTQARTAAAARRAAVRTRVLSSVGAVAVVGALGAGVVALHHSSPSDSSAAGSSAGTAATAAGAAKAPIVRGAAGASAASTAFAAVCPVSSHHVMQTPGRTPEQLRKPLFSRPVQSVLVCSYAPGLAGGPAGRFVLAGSAATDLVASLEHASAAPPAGMCNDLARPDEHRVAFVGVTASGEALPAVTTTVNLPSCRAFVTNGVSIRYGWAPSVSLAEQLARVTPAGTVQTPILHNGSPVRS